MSVDSDQTDEVPLLKRAFVALEELQAKLDLLESARSEPLAIIGQACRMPGGVDTPASFWQVVRDGIDKISQIPSDRWDADAFYDSDPDTPGKMNTRWGGFLERVDEFDADFFGIAPREAARMDPQQRLLLEVAYEALDQAGQTDNHLIGSKTGVFIGVVSQSNDYCRLQYQDTNSIDAYVGSGTSHDIFPSRLAYLFDLRGPSIAVDTACSSSLVAVHLACQSLRAGECDMAVAGGVNLILSPEFSIAASKMRLFAADGRCKSFDARADGIVLGEGCGVVLVKRLSDALAAGDPILALIRGSAVNQDGRTNGLTAPNLLSQQAVIRQALANAGVSASQISYVEAHGTGTVLGDPIEVEALAEVFGQPGANGESCTLSSVKTNFGHLEAAAGIAGLIKVVLSLQHEAIPPNLHFEKLNPFIKLDGTRLEIASELRPWPANAHKRLAGVSSFGWGGTNAHVVLEEAPTAEATSQTETDGSAAYVLPISARSEGALRDLAAAYVPLLQTTTDHAALRDLCYTAALRRSHHAHRLAVTGVNGPALAQRLETWGESGPLTGVAQGRQSAAGPPKLVFVFSGQGAQWLGMGRQLLAQEPVFRQTLEQCDELLRAHVDWSLLAELQADEAHSRFTHTEVAQPLLFALHVALTELWRSWGVQPAAVVGHSMGEVAAAYAAGLLTLPDAVRVIAQRGQVMRERAGTGRMLAVELSEAAAQQVVAGFGDRLSLAAVNSPQSCVLAGEAEALAEVAEQLKQRGVPHRDLAVNYPFHSVQMAGLEPQLTEALGTLELQAPLLEIVSTVTGQLINNEAEARLPVNQRSFGPAYWGQSIRQRVLFRQAVTLLAQRGYDVFVEVGPHPVLGKAIQEVLADVESPTPLVVGSLRRERDERVSMLHSLAQLYCLGQHVNWSHFFPGGGRCVNLPSYPWQRQRYWIDPPSTAPAAKGMSSRRITTSAITDSLYEVSWQPKTLIASQRAKDPQRYKWLILADRGGVAEAAATQLRLNGDVCTLLFSGQLTRSTNANDYEINLDQTEGQQLLRELLTSDRSQPVAVVHLWSLDAPEDVATPDALTAAQQQGCGSVLHLVQVLASASDATRLWLVTRNAQPVAPLTTPLAVAQAPLWGLGRVITLEHPELKCTLVDVPSAVTEQEAASLLLTEFDATDGEDQVAWRDSQRYVARLRHSGPGPLPDCSIQALAINSTASYLITGGLGGLGLQVAYWLVQQGARHLVLLSRRAFPARAEWPNISNNTQITAIQSLESQGATVRVVQADVANIDQLKPLFEDLRHDPNPLRGIIHAAGISQPCPLLEMTAADLQNVLRPKVQGAWALHNLTLECELDFFVLFSSAASLWGLRHQAHYAAANQFLDALAHYRRGKQLPALSVNWGPWAGGGMSTQEATSWFERMGVGAMDPNQALDTLAYLIHSGVTQQTVALVEWEKFTPVYELRRARPFLNDVRVAVQTNGNHHRKTKLDIVERVKSAGEHDRLRLLVTYVGHEVANIMGFTGSPPLDTRRGLFDLGMDSLMAVDLQRRLASGVGQPLPPTLTFDHPTIDALARYLYREVLLLDSSAAALTRPKGDPTNVEANEPIAIIGIGCRLPGGIKSVASFWQILRDGVDAVTNVPPDRWDVDAHYDPDPDAPGKMNTRRGGFIDEVDQFDAHFFNISPREAARMDPQQRLLLEVAWDALENAGQPADELVNTKTGIFIGISTSDYFQLATQRGAAYSDIYTGTGSMSSVTAGRVSYVLGIQGPCMAIDTACSSSLVTAHLACQSLRSAECDMALAAGVNLILTPDYSVYLSKLHALAADGRCKTFDAAADGYVRGEGCGVIVLKRLSDALAAGDPILALIRGSAVNHDGRSSGLTVPNGIAQQSLIREALDNAGVEPEQVSYVEAHGTGTPIGDPIEIRALGEVFGKGRDAEQRLLIGSAKTNIGHLESAAGVAGLIKLTLALQHKQIPPHLHLKEINPYISLDEACASIPTELTPWTAINGRRIAGISSFGVSGTNAHVVLEEAPARETTSQTETHKDVAYVLPISARSEGALRELAAAYVPLLQTTDDAALRDLCYTAARRRSHHAHRLAVTGAHGPAMAQRLETWRESGPLTGVAQGRQSAAGSPKLVFVFSGQGAQWLGMGRQLLAQEPVFRQTLEQCDELLRAHVDWSLLEELQADEAHSRFTHTEVAQPLLFALHVALTELWRSWGVRPAAVVGHSMGEVAAAYVAGLLTLPEAVRVIAQRGQVMRERAGTGRMLAVELSEAAAQQVVTGFGDRLSLAAVNSPQSCVLAGETEALAEVAQQLSQRGVPHRDLAVNYPFHSVQMAGLEPQLTDVLGTLDLQTPSLEIASTVTGQLLNSEAEARLPVSQRSFGPAYWGQSIRQRVLFRQAVTLLAQRGYEVFVEVGPHPVLSKAIQEVLAEVESPTPLVVGSLRRDREERAEMLYSMAQLYCVGQPVNWSTFFPGAGRCVTLPSYPWQHQRYWIEPPSPPKPEPTPAARQHPLLGRQLRSALKEILFESQFSASSPEYLNDHRMRGVVVVPASSHLSMILSAAKELYGSGACVIEDASFPQVLVLGDGEFQTVQLIMSPANASTAPFSIYSDRGMESGESNWTVHATGAFRIVGTNSSSIVATNGNLTHAQTRCQETFAASNLYRDFWDVGYHLGRTFQWIEHAWRRDGEAVCQMRLPEAVDEPGKYELHPGLIDSCFQTFCLGLPDGGVVQLIQGEYGYVPISVAHLKFNGSASGRRLWCHARLHENHDTTKQAFTGDLRLVDEQGVVVMEVEGLCVKRVEHGPFLQPRPQFSDDWLYKLTWKPTQLQMRNQKRTAHDGKWLIFADKMGVAQALRLSLETQGARCVTVVAGETYRRVDDNYYEIAANSPSEFKQMLASTYETDPSPWAGVVYLWGLDAPKTEDLSLESLSLAQELNCNAPLHLVQALVNDADHPTPKLWLASRGVPLSEDVAHDSLSQSLLWGFARVVAIEHPELRCTRVNLCHNLTSDLQARALLTELSAADDEDEIAFEGNQRYVARLAHYQRAAFGEPGLSRINGEGVYLISGGLGGLGLEVAHWLVARGARHLALLSRSGPQSEAHTTALARLQQAGAQVLAVAADVADPEALQHLLAQLQERSWGPLRGIVHAAGVLDDGILLRLDASRFQSVLRPKVAGAWNLHLQTLDAPLDFFIMFSSAASLLGSAGQANYAAANAFLDSLAHHRRALNRPALSINWGPWSDVGMAANFKTSALTAIRPQRGLTVLEQLLTEATQGQIGVIPFKLEQWCQFNPSAAQASLLKDLLLKAEIVDAPAAPTSRLRAELEQLEPGPERRSKLEQHLQQQLGQVLGLSPSDVDILTPLGNMGLNSLTGLELSKRLEKSLGITLPATLAWNYPTIAALTPHLANKMGIVLDPPSETGREVTPSIPVRQIIPEDDELAKLLTEVQGLTDEELRQSFDADRSST